MTTNQAGIEERGRSKIGREIMHEALHRKALRVTKEGDLQGRQLPVGGGPGADARPEQAVEELCLEEAAGKPPAELGEVGLEMLSGDPVVHPPQDSLDLGEEHVHPGQPPLASFPSPRTTPWCS